MRSKSFLIVLFVVLFSQVQAQLPEEKVAWFKDAKFGMFVHWGLYSILGGTYNGHTLPDTTLPNGRSWYAEWIQQRLEVPQQDYDALVQKFNPTHFDADAWIAEAHNAGMKYFVITAKHHDGFALWDSKVSDYTIAATPFKDRDILGELAAACKKYGLKLGFYYSHWHDWKHPGGAKPYWKSQPTQAAYEKYWQEKSLPQVAELLERYDPDILWFDTWDEEAKEFMTPHRRDELISLVRSKSDKCLINGRIAMHDPGDQIDFLEMMDNKYPTTLQSKPWQTPATMQHSWGYHTQDFNWKPADQMLRYLFNNAANGGNYLLNVGPSPLGEIPLQAVERLRQMGAWMLTNGECIYHTRPFRVADNNESLQNIQFTQSEDGQMIFAGLFEAVERFYLKLPNGKVKQVSFLETGQPLKFSFNDGFLDVSVPPARKYDSSLRIIKIEVE